MRTRSRDAATRVAADPLVRTAWPLVLNVVSNGLLGVAYWVVAARLFDERTVAVNSALIAAMSTLSGFGQLNLGQGLAVLIPRAGERARRVVLASYAAATGFTVLLLAAFLALVLPHLELATVLDDWPRMLVFSVGVLLLNVFALQDTSLVSFRLGTVVPVENAVFGTAKILLLLPLAAAAPTTGIFLSWLLPMALLVPLVNAVLLGTRREPHVQEQHELRQATVRELALDYGGYVFQAAATVLLPVVALELLPTLEAAVFSIAWLTSRTVDLLAVNVGTALTVEHSYGGDASALRRSVVRHGYGMVAAAVAVGVLLAPLIMAVYGESYREHGTDALRLLLAAGIFRAAVTFAVADARGHHAYRFIVYLRVQNCVLSLGLSVALAPRFGLTGMAVGYLVAQVVGAAAALPRLLTGRRGSEVRPQ